MANESIIKLFEGKKVRIVWEASDHIRKIDEKKGNELPFE